MLLALAVTVFIGGGTLAPKPVSETRLGADLKQAYGNLPMRFEANQGQTDSSVRFLSRGSGYGLFLTSGEAVLVLSKTTEPLTKQPGESAALRSTSLARESTAIRMRFDGANPDPKVTGEAELPGKSNYFIGSDPQKWRTDVPNYARVELKNVYPGIDQVYYGNQNHLEYDLVVAAGADPSVIRIAFEGARKLRIGGDGGLLIDTGCDQLYQHQAGCLSRVQRHQA